MSDHSPQDHAQNCLDLAAEVSAEFGWQIECEAGVQTAKFLYENHGPFELDWPYGIHERGWYDG